MPQLEINVKRLIISTNIDRLIVSDSAGFWSAKINLDKEWDGLNKKIVFYTNTAAVDVLIPEDNVVQVPFEVLTPNAELRFTISGYNDTTEIHTKEMMSSVRVYAAGKNTGDDPEAYTPELWEQVMASLPGDSAYEIAVKNGFEGSEEEWLKSLEGDKGDKGDTGSSGVYIGAEEPTDEDVLVWINPEGEADEITSVETDEKYFEIDYDGIISLKPEYRGHPEDETYPYAVSDNGVGADGSKIDELPENIVIPDVVDGTAVTGFQEGMLYGNERIKELTIPDVVEEIPTCFCREAVNLKTVNGTENITKVAGSGFAYTRVAKLLFPNLQEMASGAFGACSYLYSIDIGNNVTEIPNRAFYQCQFLSYVKGGSKVTTIGEKAFYLTTNLKNLPLLSNVTSIGNYAFYRSRIQFDWTTIESQCTFGEEQSTPVRDNTTDYWTGIDYTPCELPLNTIMSQQDDRWDEDLIGTTTRDNGDPSTYLYGCAVFSILHIHSAFSGKEYTHPDEFIAEVQAIDPTLYTSGHPADSADGALAALGYTVTIVQPAYTDGDYVTSEDYKTICDALARGAYVLSSVSTTESEDGGHEVVIYGINDNGEVLVADSNCVQEKYRATGGDEEMKGFLKYRIPLQNLTGPYSGFRIVEKG